MIFGKAIGLAISSFIMSLSIMAALGSVCLGQSGGLDIRLAVTGAQLAAASSNSQAVPAPGGLGYTPSGELLVIDSSDRNKNEVLRFDFSTEPPTSMRIVGETELKAKVVAAGGMMPSIMTLQAVDVDRLGTIIILATGGNEGAYLFAVDPVTAEIRLLSGLDGPPPMPSTIKGSTGLVVGGTTAYLLLEDNLGSLFGDSIAMIDTTAPDGGATKATELMTSEQLQSLTGQPAQDIQLNDGVMNPLTGNLIVINSGRQTSSNDLLEINVKTGAISVLVSGTTIKAAFSCPCHEAVIGLSAIGAASDGTLFLSNFNGDPKADGIIAIADAGQAHPSVSLFISKTKLLSDPHIVGIDGKPVSDLHTPNSGLIVSNTGAVLFSDNKGTHGIISVRKK